MTQEELQNRRNNLLAGTKLITNIVKMIKLKSLPADYPSITTITGQDGRSEIVVELYIDMIYTNSLTKTYLYITEDIFDENEFKLVDEAIGWRINRVNIDDRILLRALRVIFTAIKDISAGDVKGLDLKKWIYVRTQKTGACEYKN